MHKCGLDDILRTTERALRSYVHDEALVEHFTTARGDATAPIVPNLSLSESYRGADLEAIAAAHGASLYRSALLLAAEQARNHRLTEQVDHYKKHSLTDELTDLDNRRSLDQKADLFFARAHREGSPVHVLMLDIDRFKSVNDRYGHTKGDEVLKWFADQLRDTSRASDVIGRYGGEEFSVIAYGGTTQDAYILAERIRTRIESKSSQLFAADEPISALTVSIGLATYHPKTEPENMRVVREAEFARADECLYRAKKSGRNTVVSCSDPR